MQADGLDAQRRFCGVALAKLVRLCADLKYIQSDVLPRSNPAWLSLIPPSDHPTNPPPNPDKPGTLEPPFEDLMTWLRDKTPVDAMREKFRDVLMAGEGASRATALEQFVHALLLRAQAAPYHTETLLARYDGLLRDVCADVRLTLTATHSLSVLCCFLYVAFGLEWRT